MKSFDAIIVGGGAAGLWAAGTAAARGRRVLVLEKNTKAGVKILMSGGTRCNITHDCSSADIAAAFGPEGRALLSPLSRLSPSDVIGQLNAMGLATKSEPGGKIFPVSDSAVDVRDAILRRATNSGAIVLTGTAVVDVSKNEQTRFVVSTSEAAYDSESLLLCTGGLSYSGCGTTGDGYPWLEKFGHTLSKRRPALAPVISSASLCKSLQGLTMDDVAIKIVPSKDYSKKLARHRHEYRGGFLWTHFGCSGPTAMNVSRWISDLSDYSTARLMVDVLPDCSAESLSNWLTEGKSTASSKFVKNFLGQRFPSRLVEVLLESCQLRDSTPMAELSKAGIQALIQNLKRLTIPVHGTRGYPKAEVTAGGVVLAEVDFQTMQSRIVDGLFLAGEILDLDGPIGGYNFQAAWSTGHTAGLHL